jgi:hypothetical protein
VRELCQAARAPTYPHLEPSTHLGGAAAFALPAAAETNEFGWDFPEAATEGGSGDVALFGACNTVQRVACRVEWRYASRAR